MAARRRRIIQGLVQLQVASILTGKVRLPGGLGTTADALGATKMRLSDALKTTKCNILDALGANLDALGPQNATF